jgi:hypothetical protein
MESYSLKSLQTAVELLNAHTHEIMLRFGQPLQEFCSLYQQKPEQVERSYRECAAQSDYHLAMFLANVGIEFERLAHCSMSGVRESCIVVMNIVDPQFAIFTSFILDKLTGTEAGCGLVKQIRNRSMANALARWMDVCTALSSWDDSRRAPATRRKIARSFAEFYFPFQIGLVADPMAPSGELVPEAKKKRQKK